MRGRRVAREDEWEGREWRVREIIQCVILCTRDTTAKLHVSAFALHRLQLASGTKRR
ncbi:MAG: hypothetical protein ACKERG_03950 [Candidatus Hodgkinia cicadicola]